MATYSAASLIESARVDFVITEAPTDATIEAYIQQLQQFKVHAVIQGTSEEPLRLNFRNFKKILSIFPCNVFPLLNFIIITIYS